MYDTDGRTHTPGLKCAHTCSRTHAHRHTSAMLCVAMGVPGLATMRTHARAHTQPRTPAAVRRTHTRARARPPVRSSPIRIVSHTRTCQDDTRTRKHTRSLAARCALSMCTPHAHAHTPRIRAHKHTRARTHVHTCMHTHMHPCIHTSTNLDLSIVSSIHLFINRPLPLPFDAFLHAHIRGAVFIRSYIGLRIHARWRWVRERGAAAGRRRSIMPPSTGTRTWWRRCSRAAPTCTRRPMAGDRKSVV